MLKSSYFASALAISLLVSTPTVVFAHAGHGDEFQAEGGIDRVQVNPETDPILGIEITPIEPAADGTILIPVTALVEAGDQSIVFVKYENFYEPVPVTQGETQGEQVAIASGLSVGEQLVTQGSLSLYAESRKAPTETAEAENADTAPNEITHAEADAQGIPHSHDAAGNLAQSSEVATAETAAKSGGLPIGKIAIGGGVLAMIVGAIAVFGGGKKQKAD
ncbi:MAG: cobalt transporter [Spirulina sp. SIO3F2]|nr:cobalt transporter [Spirulina sp. SIO3F2]